MNRAEAQRELNSAPEIKRKSVFFWRAFNELMSERSVGMDIGPIPFTSIIAYGSFFKLTHRENEALTRIIRILDNRFLNMRADKRRKESEKQSSKSTQAGVQVTDSW